MLVQTLREAKAKGTVRYFTGRPCPHGHISERYTCGSACVQCTVEDRAKNLNRIRETNNKYRATTRGRAVRLHSNARIRAKRYGMDFNLSVAWVQERIEQGVCPVTGLPFDLSVDRTAANERKPFTPSIDRIDSKKGYTEDNCQVVVWIYNAAKCEWGEKPLATLVAALALRM